MRLASSRAGTLSRMQPSRMRSGGPPVLRMFVCPLPTCPSRLLTRSRVSGGTIPAHAAAARSSRSAASIEGLSGRPYRVCCEESAPQPGPISSFSDPFSLATLTEHDPALRFDLHDPDRERSWKIVEVPRDGCSRLKASLGSARHEIARQLRGVDDGLEDLRDRFGDPRCYREGQVHLLPPCLPGPSLSAQFNSEPTGEGRAVRNSLGHATGPSQSGAMNCQRT